LFVSQLNDNNNHDERADDGGIGEVCRPNALVQQT